MSWALSMIASAIPGRPEPRLGDPVTPSRARSPLTPGAPAAPCGACEEDKMPPWLSGHAISRPPLWNIDAAQGDHDGASVRSRQASGG